MQKASCTNPVSRLWLWALLPLLLAAALVNPPAGCGRLQTMSLPLSSGWQACCRLRALSLEQPGITNCAFRIKPGLAAAALRLGAPRRLDLRLQSGRCAASSACCALRLGLPQRARGPVAPRSGLFACAAAQHSCLSQTYMMHARAFTWRSLLCMQPASGPTGALPLLPLASRHGRSGRYLLLGSGLLYSHYFSALLLPRPRPFSPALRAKEPSSSTPADIRQLPALLGTCCSCHGSFCPGYLEQLPTGSGTACCRRSLPPAALKEASGASGFAPLKLTHWPLRWCQSKRRMLSAHAARWPLLIAGCAVPRQPGLAIWSTQLRFRQEGWFHSASGFPGLACK